MMRARKRFGQNFLQDQQMIQRIVAAIQPQLSQHLVEIGPGLGALTCQLLPLVGELDVVELDYDLIPQLKANCQNLGQLNIHQADALQFDFCQLKTNEQQLRVVGNLPYNISTPLLFHLLEQLSCIADMHFMLQKEVVERIVAKPGNKVYGRLSVMLQYHCRVEKLFLVKPGAFKPVPKVDSAVVRLVPHENITEPAHDLVILSEVVKAAFAKRRKTLRNSLSALITPDALTALNIEPTRRPEQLTVAEFVKIANSIRG